MLVEYDRLKLYASIIARILIKCTMSVPQMSNKLHIIAAFYILKPYNVISWCIKGQFIPIQQPGSPDIQ